MQNNNLPDWWKIVKLKDYTTERKQKNKANEELTVFSISNKRWFVKSDDYFEWQVYSKDLKNYKIVKKWDFAYNPARINVWSIAYLESEEIWLLSPMYVIFSLNKEIDKDYFNYFIKWNLFNKQVNNFTQWAVRQILSFWDLWNISLLLPPLEVQKEIAWKVSDLDTLIETQNNQIEKYEKLKKAMMKKLFNEWIWHTEFKEDSFLWKIPQSWDIKRLWNLVSNPITKWTTPTTYWFDFIDEWINFIRIENINSNLWYINLKDKKFISEECNLKLKRSILKENDILFAIAWATIWKTVLIRNMDLPANTNQALAIIRINNTKYNLRYIFSYLRWYKIQDYIENIKTHTWQPNLNLEQVWNFKIPIPKIEEQKKIADILENIDNLLEKERKIKFGYEKVKKWIVSLVFSCNLLIK